MAFTLFIGASLLARGERSAIAVAAREALAGDPDARLLAFDDDTGRQVDFDEPQAPPRKVGRPKLGVVAREVTLLPRHWDWLAAQPGGASVALRKLVEAARRDPAEQARARRDAAWRFMNAIGGDLPAFEDASRALFAGDHDRLLEMTAGWPADIRQHALRLLQAEG
jgi:hypothetical protein